MFNEAEQSQTSLDKALTGGNNWPWWDGVPAESIICVRVELKKEKPV